MFCQTQRNADNKMWRARGGSSKKNGVLDRSEHFAFEGQDKTRQDKTRQDKADVRQDKNKTRQDKTKEDNTKIS